MATFALKWVNQTLLVSSVAVRVGFLNSVCVKLPSDANEVRRACERISDEVRLDEKGDLKIYRLRVRGDARGGALFCLGKTRQVVDFGAIN